MLDPVVRMPMDTRIDIEGNWNKFSNAVLETKKKGADKLLETLAKTDFKTAPASHNHHLALPGGLCQHSLNTWEYSLFLNGMIGTELSEASLGISALLHDLCKINYYSIGEEFDKEYKNKTDRWRKKEVYVVDDKLPLGHGEKSLAIALGYGVELEPEECLAIRWHMAFSDAGVHFGYPSGMPFRQSFNVPLVKIIAMADQAATIHEDHVWSKETEKPL